LDDAEEIVALEKGCKQQHFELQFEISRPRAPLRNGKVERKLPFTEELGLCSIDSGIVDMFEMNVGQNVHLVTPHGSTSG
jgi:hypothetical protein